MILLCCATELGLPKDLSAIEVILYYYYYYCNKIIVFYVVNVTALNGFKTGQSTIQSMLNDDPQLNC